MLTTKHNSYQCYTTCSCLINVYDMFSEDSNLVGDPTSPVQPRAGKKKALPGSPTTRPTTELAASEVSTGTIIRQQVNTVCEIQPVVDTTQIHGRRMPRNENQ